MNPQRHRLRRILKWACGGVCFFSLALLLVSAKWSVYVDCGRYELYLGGGTLSVSWSQFDIASGTWDISAFEVDNFVQRIGLLDLPSLNILEWAWGFGLPLWWVVVLFACPMTYRWWRNRRIRPGYCSSCGYNLTANTTGICPECGTHI